MVNKDVHKSAPLSSSRWE